jgi:transposase-like protein
MKCPKCQSENLVKSGKQPMFCKSDGIIIISEYKQRYHCKDCHKDTIKPIL